MGKLVLEEDEVGDFSSGFSERVTSPSEGSTIGVLRLELETELDDGDHVVCLA